MSPAGAVIVAETAVLFLEVPSAEMTLLVNADTVGFAEMSAA
jgi:hypothetical protein